jgi:hypothetical protein
MEEQLGFDLGESKRQDAPLFDPDEIRGHARDQIAEAREVGVTTTWTADELRYRRILFPHLVSWIPDEEERNQLCFTFTTELDRIELLLAA